MIRERNFTIAAGAEVVVQGVGTFIGVLSVSDTTQELEIKGVNEGGQEILSARLLQGERIILDRTYNQLRIKNPGAASVSIDVLVGTGRFESGRLTGAVSVDVPGTLTANTKLTVAGVPVVQTIAANAARKNIMIKADSANAGLIWVGGVVDDGIPLAAGENIVLDGTAAVDLLGTAGGDVIYSLEQGA